MRSATNSCSPGKSKVRISPIDSNTKVSWLLQFLLSLNLEFAFVLAIVTFSIERRAAYHRTADILLVPGGLSYISWVNYVNGGLHLAALDNRGRAIGGAAFQFFIATVMFFPFVSSAEPACCLSCSTSLEG